MHLSCVYVTLTRTSRLKRRGQPARRKQKLSKLKLRIVQQNTQCRKARLEPHVQRK